MIPQAELPLFEILEADQNIDWLVGFLAGRDWTTANEVLRAADKPQTDSNRRWVRALAAASKGRIAGGQLGYKLVKSMTNEEYNHWRNWMKSQADEMTARILAADKVFFVRQPVQSGNGILSGAEKAKA